MRQGFIAAAVLAAGLALLSPVQAATKSSTSAAGAPKIGIVNLQQVINDSTPGKLASDQLNKLAADLRGQIDDRKKKLLDVKTQLDKADAKSDSYQKLLKAYEDGNGELQQFSNMSQQDYNQRQQELLGPIQQELGKVLDTYGKANRYDIILSRSVQGAVFASDAYDVTAELTAAMNKDYDAQQKAQATPAPAATTHKG
jgi:outer membrane protein